MPSVAIADRGRFRQAVADWRWRRSHRRYVWCDHWRNPDHGCNVLGALDVRYRSPQLASKSVGSFLDRGRWRKQRDWHWGLSPIVIVWCALLLAQPTRCSFTALTWLPATSSVRIGGLMRTRPDTSAEAVASSCPLGPPHPSACRLWCDHWRNQPDASFTALTVATGVLSGHRWHLHADREYKLPKTAGLGWIVCRVAHRITPPC